MSTQLRRSLAGSGRRSSSRRSSSRSNNSIQRNLFHDDSGLDSPLARLPISILPGSDVKPANGQSYETALQYPCDEAWPSIVRIMADTSQQIEQANVAGPAVLRDLDADLLYDSTVNVVYNQGLLGNKDVIKQRNAEAQVKKTYELSVKYALQHDGNFNFQDTLPDNEKPNAKARAMIDRVLALKVGYKSLLAMVIFDHRDSGHLISYIRGYCKAGPHLEGALPLSSDAKGASVAILTFACGVGCALSIVGISGYLPEDMAFYVFLLILAVLLVGLWAKEESIRWAKWLGLSY